VAPYGLRRGIVERIDGERERAERGETAGIRIKVNGLVDEQVIDALYRASAAGVPVDLVVRGLCSLRAGVPGLSENIRVRSILGRFLEHSRIFHFVGAGEHWIGSADMMHRNLDRRVEALVPVTDPRLTAQLDKVLDSATAPSTRSWILQPDGSWDPWPVAAGEGTEGLSVCDHQVQLLQRRPGEK
jgi:polyphosphate kinase